MTRILLSAMLLLLMAALSPVQAIELQERLADPVLESRAREIGRELRCLVCKNESIEDSNAELARDLRRLVRERVMAGDSNSTIFDYLVSRYGEFVLLAPLLRTGTLALWFGPSFLLVSALVWFLVRHRSRADPQPLSEDETKLLALLLEKERR
jgi:cytochrome c-type biogenesis protein CcmH